MMRTENSRRWTAVGVASIVLALAACSAGGESASETTSVPSTDVPTSLPATTTTSQSPRLSDPVVEYYDALNTEDVDRMMQAWPTGDRELFEVITAGFHEKVSATCSPGNGGDTTVQCDEDLGRHDFYTPAGVRGQVTVLFTVDDGVIIERRVVTMPESFDVFEEAFGAWLQTEHPEVLESFSASGEYPFATSEDALVAIALVGDFVAQSDTYPLEG